MHSWKFTDSEGNLCIAEYNDCTDKFTVSTIDCDSFFLYDPDEVEDYLNRGIWKRIS